MKNYSLSKTVSFLLALVLLCASATLFPFTKKASDRTTPQFVTAVAASSHADCIEKTGLQTVSFVGQHIRCQSEDGGSMPDTDLPGNYQRRSTAVGTILFCFFAKQYLANIYPTHNFW